MRHILVVDDEAPIRQLLTLALSRSHYKVSKAETGGSALKTLQQDKTIDIMLLDWMLPDIGGIQLLKDIRTDNALQTLRTLPIIMLTSKAEENNILKGFKYGADDYITKPFSPKELLARIHAILRRAQPITAQAELYFKNLLFNIESKQLFYNGILVKCSRLEFNLLKYLTQNTNKILSRERLLNDVWLDQWAITERTVDVHIRRIRKILEPFGYNLYIQSVRGEGYLMTDSI